MERGSGLQASFRADGFVQLPGFLDVAATRELAAAVETAPERDPGVNPLSLGTMRFASNLFYGSEALQRFLCSPAVVDLVSALLGPDAWVRWDQAVWKHPGAPEFPMHQDNGYTGLDAEHLQLWVALTASTERDGGLVVVPGGHRTRLDHRWVGHHVTANVAGEQVAVDADAGDVIAFSSLLPHATTPNVGHRTRLAYVAEFLPIAVDDPSVPAPHFVVVEGGRASGRFTTAGDAPGLGGPAGSDGTLAR